MDLSLRHQLEEQRLQEAHDHGSHCDANEDEALHLDDVRKSLDPEALASTAVVYCDDFVECEGDIFVIELGIAVHGACRDVDSKKTVNIDIAQRWIRQCEEASGAIYVIRVY